jgi:hypothetical protein
VVCSPVTNTSMNSMKSLSSWTAACLGASYAQAGGVRLRDLHDLRLEQRIQDEQGRSAFASEGMTSQTPATAHMGATPEGGVPGPYPWRRPV